MLRPEREPVFTDIVQCGECGQVWPGRRTYHVPIEELECPNCGLHSASEVGERFFQIPHTLH